MTEDFDKVVMVRVRSRDEYSVCSENHEILGELDLGRLRPKNE
jgi:hypothetical protein